MNVFTWINELLGTENAEGIIAISALLAWMLPKLLYFCVKFIFNTLLFLANVFSRDKLELWLKSKINYFLANLAHGAKVSDIPRWLNKDQFALREVHWDRAGTAAAGQFPRFQKWTAHAHPLLMAKRQAKNGLSLPG